MAKSLARDDTHCHRWENTLHLVESARTDRERAFAYGYLSHLAADTVAHNFFVPHRMVAGFPTRRPGHAYWEIRTDLHVRDAVLPTARALLGADLGHGDRLHRAHIQGTLFSFRTNRTLFRAAMRVQNRQSFRRWTEREDERLAWDVSPAEFEMLRKRSLGNVMSFLRDFDRSDVVALDPRGQRSIQEARQMRKALQARARAGMRPGESRALVRHSYDATPGAETALSRALVGPDPQERRKRARSLPKGPVGDFSDGRPGAPWRAAMAIRSSSRRPLASQVPLHLGQSAPSVVVCG